MSIQIELTAGDYVAALTIERGTSILPFSSEWTCDPKTAFQEESGKAVNLLGDPDLSLIGSLGQTFGKLISFRDNNDGSGERYGDGEIPESFRWRRV